MPFRAAIDAGTEFVMAGHATYPALDGLHIASQSPAVIDGLLRRSSGFDGVVMTDSLEAAAVLAVGDVEESARGVGAGGRRRDPDDRPRLVHPRLPRAARARRARTPAFRAPRARVRRPRARRAIIQGWLTPQPHSGSATPSRPSR